MIKKVHIPDIWLKAAILGSLWASIEIILGSFLHNLRVPMVGTLLSAVGTFILIGGHQIWPNKGLFWRAGLICAVMKSISPSAIIIGPMIGIFMEGVLLEIGIRLLGMNILGYLVGGALAVSWSMVQKIINLLIALGSDFVHLYKNLYHFAAKNLGVTSIGPFDIVLTFFVLQMALGGIVSLFSIHYGRIARNLPMQDSIKLDSKKVTRSLSLDPTQKFSRLLLCIHLLSVIAGLYLLNIGLWVGLAFVSVYIVFTLSRYRRSLNRLKKPSLWIGLFIVLMLSGIFLNGISSQILNWQGLLAGFTMAVRAVLVIIAFSALSIELRNPYILNWFMQRGLQDFPKALGIAFETLPHFIAYLSEQKYSLNRIKTFLPTLLKQADEWLYKFKDANTLTQPIVILTGKSGQGKTTLVKKVAEKLLSQGYNVQGIYAPGLWQNNQRLGFDVQDIATNKKVKLCRQHSTDGYLSVGPFHFFKQGIEFGRQVLSQPSKSADFVFVDEVGPLELRDQGWAPALDKLTHTMIVPMLWVIRKQVIREVSIRWMLEDPIILDVNKVNSEELVDQLISLKKI